MKKDKEKDFECGYCKSNKLKLISDKPSEKWEGRYEFECKDCGKSFIFLSKVKEGEKR